MARYTPEQLAFAVVAAVESAHFYSAFLPSLMTIGAFATNEERLRDLRRGEIVATGFTLALGWALSVFSESSLPFWFTVIMAGAMLCVYESRIRQAQQELAGQKVVYYG